MLIFRKNFSGHAISHPPFALLAHTPPPATPSLQQYLSFAAPNARHIALRYTMGNGNCAQGPCCSAYRADSVITSYSYAGMRLVLSGAALARYSVLRVVLRRSCFQMRDIDATRIVAPVAHKNVAWQIQAFIDRHIERAVRGDTFSNSIPRNAYKSIFMLALPGAIFQTAIVDRCRARSDAIGEIGAIFIIRDHL